MPDDGPGGGKRSRALVVALGAAFAGAFALLASGVLTPRNGGTEENGNGGITWAENGRRVLLEAERAGLAAPMRPADDGEASGRQCLHMPCAFCDGDRHVHLPPEERKKASASLSFTLEKPGEYALWMRTKWCCECGDTFNIALDGGETIPFGGDGANKGRWKWRCVMIDGRNPRRFKLDAGEHSLVLTPREDGWRVDQVLLTTDRRPPQGVEKAETGP